ncbi:serum paraoxonase lactonase 3 [Diplodia corticola]|uniref:Serum paraoxonase lactonase 3 n=1 Tax=Diplodia corticola TaxID=236234 RepID=A0A1J9S8C5_9PEZI|nr:serum paraoxonase lactonase 3 [Diplodia corticola]OJD36759.1 serum paraoxonase lactonase 3 [Diplodia corticola]
MLGKILPAVALGGVALLWPELSWRVGTLQLVTADVASLKHTTTFKEQQIKHQDILKNCEDVVVLEDQGVAILSCDPQRDAWNTVMGTFLDPTQPGAIFQWFYSNPDSYPQPLALENFGSRGSVDFHPLGIEYHEESATLFVTNHASSGPTIEIFDYVPWGGFGRASATHRASVSHPALWTPNSIHALNATSFLVTNDHRVRARDHFILNKLETYGALPGGSVVQVTLPSTLPPRDDGDDGPLALDPAAIAVTQVAANIPFANGVAVLDAGRTLAVASTNGRAVRLYNITSSTTADDGTDGTISLAFKDKIFAPAMLDNLSVDSRGRLLAAGHPRPGALTATVAFRADCLSLRAKAHAIALAAEQEVERKLGEDNVVQQDPMLMSDQEDVAAAVEKKTVEVVMTEEEKGRLERCVGGFDATSPSWVGELLVDERTGEATGEWKELYVGSEFGSSCTAARDLKEGVVLVVGLYEKGVLVAKE